MGISAAWLAGQTSRASPGQKVVTLRFMQGKLTIPDKGSVVLRGPHGGGLGDLQHVHGGSSQAGIRAPALTLGRVTPVLHTK